MSRPFLRVKDAGKATRQEAQRLYDQASSVSSIAYLLLGAAGPLSAAQGSFSALLPYLDPPLMRVYASRPGRHSSPLVAQLYNLSQSLYGTATLQDCHYELFRALRAVFSWVAANVPLRLRAPPGGPRATVATATVAATAARPDFSALLDADLAAAVQDALLQAAAGGRAVGQRQVADLAAAAATVTGACGLSLPDFAALVPRISAALSQLHADLPRLQALEAERRRRFAAEPAGSSGSSSLTRIPTTVASASVWDGLGEIANAVVDLQQSMSKPQQKQQSEQQPGERRRRAAQGFEGEGGQESAWEGGKDGGVDGAAAAAAAAAERESVELGVAGGPQGLESRAHHKVAAGAAVPAADEKHVSENGEASDDGSSSGGDGGGRSSLEALRRRSSRRLQQQDTQGQQSKQLQQQPLLPSFSYAQPPAGFQAQAPAAMPQLLLGLVFHILMYRDGANDTGPAGYDNALSYVQRTVRIVNFMAKPTNISFFVKEVRNDPAAYPYLMYKSRQAWLQLSNLTCPDKSCLINSDLVPPALLDYPRSINVFVGSDATATEALLGYAFVPGSDVSPLQGYVFLAWDQLATGGSNSLAAYNDGVTTLLHEIFHLLGLQHPFSSSGADCVETDYVADTPIVKGTAYDADFYFTAADYCMELFWGLYGGDWEATYERLSTTLGIPDLDKNAWADSCPKAPGYDELGNYMTYNAAVCFLALGHFTLGQAQRAHFMASVYNPVLYVWGQYFAAQVSPPLPLLLSPPPELSNNTCRVTGKSACPCKSTWRFNKRTYSYCDRTGSVNELTCEVSNRGSCPDCNPGGGQCILPCAGTPQMCKRPPAPGARMPPPPPPLPPSPPPAPPPPPPRQALEVCRMSVEGCACRSHWIHNMTWGWFCSPYPNTSPGSTWCIVTPACRTFMVRPLQPCAARASLQLCSTKISDPPTRPSPPSPPPPKVPRRPVRKP